MATIVRKLGGGGFGDVYEVDIGATRVARKVYRPQGLSPEAESDLKARFRREVKYQSQISHPNVIKILSSDLQAEPPTFDMELGERSLADEIAVDRTLGGDPTSALLDILNGLEALHNLGFSHRDLKPANVIKIKKEDGTHRYAISDFGLINVGSTASSSLTSSNMAGGSARWAAPESMINLKKAAEPADIYSFGAILHDIFDGNPRLPHSELTVTGPVGEIISRCTKKLPIRRYLSVRDLREALVLAISSASLTFQSTEEQMIVSLVSSNDPLTTAQWEDIFLFVEKMGDNWKLTRNVFDALTSEKIREIGSQDAALLQAIGVEFCRYAAGGVFNFEFCDVIGGKIQTFWEYAEVQLKSSLAIASLKLGSNHNRWSIQRLFFRLCDSQLDDGVAERIKIEVEVQDLNFQSMIEQSESATTVNRGDLHATLRALLDDNDQE
jgi:serine/threonine protein kinase